MTTIINRNNAYYIEGKFIGYDSHRGKLSILVTAPVYLKDREMKFEFSFYYYLQLPSSDHYLDYLRPFEPNKNDLIRGIYEFVPRKYMKILHKGQSCVFSAYALDEEGKSVNSRGVENRPDEYMWICDSNSFKAEKWDEASIDDLVKEIRPSRKCLKQLLKSYRADFWKSVRRKLRGLGRWCRTRPKTFWNWLKENHWVVIALGTLITAIFYALNYFTNR